MSDIRVDRMFDGGYLIIDSDQTKPLTKVVVITQNATFECSEAVFRPDRFQAGKECACGGTKIGWKYHRVEGCREYADNSLAQHHILLVTKPQPSAEGQCFHGQFVKGCFYCERAKPSQPERCKHKTEYSWRNCDKPHEEPDGKPDAAVEATKCKTCGK